MAYGIFGNKIVMTKGDTVRLRVNIQQKRTGEMYKPHNGDKLRFALKRYISNRTVELEKDIPTDTMILTLTEEDTKTLDFGVYHYDIQLTYANGYVDTIIQNGLLELKYEVN